MDLTELWLQFITFLKAYGIPLVALVISLFSYWDSRKANKFQDKLNAIEEKLKKYELEEKEKEREEATKAVVEARIINISKGNYKMKFWNSGKATAYNVDFIIPTECKGMIWRDKVPYEFLESGKSFEEHALVHMGTPNKFKVTTSWNDEMGKSFTKDQIVTI